MSMSAPPPTITRCSPGSQGSPGEGSPDAGRHMVSLPPMPPLPATTAFCKATKNRPVSETATLGKSLYLGLLKPTGGFWRPGTIFWTTTGAEKVLPPSVEPVALICSVGLSTTTPFTNLGPLVQATTTEPSGPMTGAEPWLSVPVPQLGSAATFVWSGWTTTGPWKVLPPSADLQTSICPTPPPNWHAAGLVPVVNIPMKLVTETTTIVCPLTCRAAIAGLS